MASGSCAVGGAGPDRLTEPRSHARRALPVGAGGGGSWTGLGLAECTPSQLEFRQSLGFQLRLAGPRWRFPPVWARFQRRGFHRLRLAARRVPSIFQRRRLGAAASGRRSAPDYFLDGRNSHSLRQFAVARLDSAGSRHHQRALNRHRHPPRGGQPGATGGSPGTSSGSLHEGISTSSMTACLVTGAQEPVHHAQDLGSLPRWAFTHGDSAISWAGAGGELLIFGRRSENSQATVSWRHEGRPGSERVRK